VGAGVLSLDDGAGGLLVESDDDELEPESDDPLLRESLMYQPVPLNTMPGACMTRLMTPPQDGQTVNGSSENFWNCSNAEAHSEHW
jgi:hypothetical protein